MIVTIVYLSKPDLGVAFLGYLGSFLMAGALLAVGSFFSALTKNQVISFILTVCVSFLLIMAGSPPILEFISALAPESMWWIFLSHLAYLIILIQLEEGFSA